jgi:catechol 2,3-dioxygenase-like lactoylglutathione lyase family enzyme
MSVRSVSGTMLALADVAVVVSDTAASERWWKENLGFGSYRVNDSDHAVMVSPPGDRFVLHLCAGFAPLEPGDSGIAFMTDEIEPLVARMKAKGVEFPQALTRESWGAMAKFADPDGNVFWLLEAPTAMIRATMATRAPGGERPVRASRASSSPPTRKARPSRPRKKPRPSARKPRAKRGARRR